MRFMKYTLETRPEIRAGEPPQQILHIRAEEGESMDYFNLGALHAAIEKAGHKNECIIHRENRDTITLTVPVDVLLELAIAR